MKLEDQYCLLSQSKRLKELGIDQTTQWYWCYPVDGNMISTKRQLIHTSVTYEYLSDNEGDEFNHDIASAYSVAELGVIFPCGYDTMQITGNGWAAYDLDGECVLTHYKTEAECRAAMIINLLESNAITAEECNKRLTES